MKSNRISFYYSFILILSTILLNNCIMDKVNISEGVKYYKNGHYEKSIEYFENKLKENPDNVAIRTQLFRSKLKAYFEYLTQARKYRKFNKKSLALASYHKAISVFPENFNLNQEIIDYQNLDKKIDKPFVSTIEPPIKLLVNPQDEIEKINLKSVPITKIFKAVGDTFEVNFIFDKDFKDFIYSLNVKKTRFYELLDQLCMISNSEFRILSRSSILIYPNQRYKKKQFELKGVKVFYLSNSRAEDTKKLLQTVFREQQIIVQDDPISNTLIVKTTFPTLKEIERFLQKIDKPKSEVSIDIQILEINRDIFSKLGADFGTTAIGVSAGADDGTGTFSPTMNFTDIKNTNFFVTLPTAAMSFLESNENNKILAKPNLRGINDEKIEFKIGEKIPIPKVTFSSAAAGGVSNIPITNYEYRDVGIRIEITPFIHNNGDISMQLDLKMDFISTYIDQFPVLGNRELKNFLRLKEGETSIIGGFIKDEVRKSLKGLPGLSRVPILGKLFGVNEDRITQTDVIFSITPRIIRNVNITKSDRSTVWSNIKTVSNNTKTLPTRGSPSASTSRRSPDRIVISPTKRRIAVGKTAIFTVRFNSQKDIESLNFAGNIDGGNAEIESINTSFFQKSKDVSVFDNISGSSFTLGYSFKKNMKGSTLAQIRVKFLEKGEYRLNFGNINCTSKDKSIINMEGNSAIIDVR